MKKNFISIGKLGEDSINEDAAISRNGLIAVSDGAGGGGLFAERWSRYLLENIPDGPIRSAEELDKWIERIWESFYNQSEDEAKKLGGLLLDKFYDEGSFATLVATWKTSDTKCEWISFGDSVTFCYNRNTKKLVHSFTELKDFDNPPYLINCKDELNKDGFRCGAFDTDNDSIVFATSDALAHYIIMMYEVANEDSFAEELNRAEANHSKNENFIKAAKFLPFFDFEKKVINKLINCLNHQLNFTRHIESIKRKGLIAHDDYSLTVLN